MQQISHFSSLCLIYIGCVNKYLEFSFILILIWIISTHLNSNLIQVKVKVRIKEDNDSPPSRGAKTRVNRKKRERKKKSKRWLMILLDFVHIYLSLFSCHGQIYSKLIRVRLLAPFVLTFISCSINPKRMFPCRKLFNIYIQPKR